MNKTVFLFPGQGAQKEQMGKDFYEAFSAAKEVFQQADDILGKYFSKVIFEGSSHTLGKTNNSQLAIFITSIAILKTLQSQFNNLTPHACAGLSLGEYSALVSSKKASFEDVLPIVKARGEFMQKAAQTHLGTMVVVIGLDLKQVQAQMKNLQKAGHKVWVANVNSPSQIVVSLEKKALAVVIQALKACGAKRVIALDVSGAFHSRLMMDAQQALEPMIRALCLMDSDIDLASNATGGFANSLEEIRQNLIHQITEPVLWQQNVQSLETLQPELYLEIGPGKTLNGMNRKIGVSSPTISIEKVSDLDQIQAKVNL